MKIIYNSILPFPGYAAMMLFGVIFARKEYKPLSARCINHEAIHHAQAKECHVYIFYYLRYLGQWIRYGYRNCLFEREAYDNQNDYGYLDKREPKAWKRYR